MVPYKNNMVALASGQLLYSGILAPSTLSPGVVAVMSESGGLEV